MLAEEKRNHEHKEHSTSNNHPQTEEQRKFVKIVLPYQGDKGIKLTKKLKDMVNKVLPENVHTRISFKAEKLATHFQIKDRTKIEHKHDIVYKAKCPECSETYVGESARRLKERVLDHGGRDKKSAIYRHSESMAHKAVTDDDFRILASNFTSTQRRKI